MFVRRFPRRTLLSVLFAALLLSSCGGGATAAPTADINAISTAAVETAMAQLALQFTQTAQAAPSATLFPTNTTVATLSQPTAGGAGSPTTNPGALPTVSFNTTPVTAAAGLTPLVSPVAPAPTAALGDACDNNIFVADLTIPDGTVMKPGEDFTKVWAVQNTGNCTWDDGYSLIYVGGSTPNLDPVNFDIKIEEDFVSPGETADFDIKLTTPCTVGKYEGHWRMRNDRGQYFGTILSVYVEVQTKC